MGGADYDLVTEDLNRRRTELQTSRTLVNEKYDREKDTTNAHYDGKYREELKTVDGGAMGRAKLDLLEKETPAETRGRRSRTQQSDRRR